MKKTILKSTTLVLFLHSGAALGNITEPDIIFYGKVTTQLGLTPIPINSGTLTWEIRPREGDGKRYHFTSELRSLDNGKYSYQLKIPQSLVVNIHTLQEEAEEAMSVEGQKSLFLRHYEIKVNGEPAIISDDTLKVFTVDEAHRANHQLLNLSVSSKVLGDDLDQNGNGLPDAWESLYGLTDADPLADIDGDGWTNAQEFENGTNPTVDNNLPVLVGDRGEEDKYQISIFEYGLTQLRLTVLDSNTSLDNINVIFKSIPVGLSIFNANELSTAITTGSKIKASTLNNGEIVLQYTPTLPIAPNMTGVLEEKLLLGLENTSTPMATVVDKNITLAIVNVSSIAEPLRWIDGKSSKDKNLSKILGRSGYSQDYLALHGYDQPSKGFTMSGDNFSIDERGLIDARAYISSDKIQSKLLSFPIPNNGDEALDLSGEHSIYSVFDSNSTRATIFFNDAELKLGLDNQYFTYGETNTDKYGQSTVAKNNIPNIVSLHIANNEISMQYNGMSAGGMLYHTLDQNIKISTVSGFGFTSGRYGISDGYALPFDGRIGEFVLFPHILEGMDKWKMNAYLLSKWQDYMVSDASDAISGVRLEIPQGVSVKTLLLGGISDDTLVGSMQDDILVGGTGADSLYGRDGKDRFILGDGDSVEDFEFNYASNKREDVLDLSELLVEGQQDLKHCLYLTIQNNNTIVKINKKCEGQDFSNGSDFQDSSFTIVDQSLQNSDIAILWFSGSLYTRAHKPSTVEAKISIEGVQKYTLNENENENSGEHQHYTVDIGYSGEIVFEGDALKIPLVLTGDSKPYEDFNLTMSRYIMPDDTQSIKEATNGEYEDFNTLLGLDIQTLEGYGLTIDADADISRTLLQDNYDLLKGKLMGDKIYIPANLHNETEKKISLNLTLIHDEKKEIDESLTIRLLAVPEYYSVPTQTQSIDLTLSDGLDIVSIVNSNTRLHEANTKDFVLRRTGSIDTPLLVKLSFTGSAVNGEDFEFIAEDIMFQAEQREIHLPVHGLDDSVTESVELIVLGFTEDSSYRIDTENNQANMYLIDIGLNAIDTDNDGLLDAWEEANGLNPLVSNVDSNGVYTDSDGDGLSDYEEFMLGTDPKNADSDGDGVSDSEDIFPLDGTKTGSTDSLKGYQVIKVIGEDSIKVASGMESIIQIPLSYTTSTNDDSLNGLKILVHYNSQQLEFLGFSEVLDRSFKGTEVLPEMNDIYRGGYWFYSHQVSISWSSVSENWPMMPLPTKLLTARFKLNNTLVEGEEAWVEFSSDEPAIDYALKAIQFKVNVENVEGLSALSLGRDNNDTYNVKLLTKILLGIELDATYGTPEQVDTMIKYVNEFSYIYDIDGDGEVNPLVDCVLLYRYLQGTLKEEDIVKLVNENSTRKSMIDIEDAIQRVLAL